MGRQLTQPVSGTAAYFENSVGLQLPHQVHQGVRDALERTNLVADLVRWREPVLIHPQIIHLPIMSKVLTCSRADR